MSGKHSQEELNNILQANTEQRLAFTVQQINENNTIWILTDEHGCVMLNTEDEDCVPVWPLESLAQSWATGEWSECKAESISLNKWKSRWTQGLMDDDLSIVVFPNENEEGLVLFPDEFENEIHKKNKK